MTRKSQPTPQPPQRDVANEKALAERLNRKEAEHAADKQQPAQQPGGWANWWWRR